uniref:WW domain containing adaptor with coiled-coil n=1 Tax=Dromaius novaehollandiae TaxID=8790 RepID=A0A8C4JFH5_DRONO
MTFTIALFMTCSFVLVTLNPFLKNDSNHREEMNLNLWECLYSWKGPVTLHKKIHITTVLFIVQIRILLIPAVIQARLLMQLTILRMTGLNTSALQAKSTTTTAEQKFHSGKNQKSGWKESRDKKKQAKCQLTVSQKIGITEER